MTIHIRRRGAGIIAALVVATSVLFGAPAASQDGPNDELESAPALDTLHLAQFSPAELDALRSAAVPTQIVDPWRNGSSAAESWAVATAANLAAQRAEQTRLGLEFNAALARTEVTGLALAAATNREQQIQRRLTALVVDSFVNGESDALDKLAGSQARTHINEPIEVATETLTDAKLRVAEISRAHRDTYDRRVRTAQEVEAQSRVGSYVLDEAIELDQTARRLALEHVANLRDRRTQTLAVSGEAPETVLVGGFRVSPEIADQLGALLAAAANAGVSIAPAEEGEPTADATAEDGDDGEDAAPQFSGPIIFGGWGYRSTEEQINLRMNHCGDSGFSIFDGPSPACRPPTARPLHSEHEKGLAIDFTENGAILNSSSPGYFWLKEHAATYGFFNLPSEPWHWSTTGH